MNLSKEEKIAFKEVNEIISIMGDKYKNKIPNKLLEFLKKEEEKEEKTNIKKDLHFEEQKISRKALVLLNYINRNYWVEDEKVKQRLKENTREEDEKYQKILRKKYNPDEIFKKRGKVSGTTNKM